MNVLDQLCTNCPKRGQYMVSSEQPETKGLPFCSQECEDEFTEKVQSMTAISGMPSLRLAYRDPDSVARDHAFFENLESDSDHQGGVSHYDR